MVSLVIAALLASSDTARAYAVEFAPVLFQDLDGGLTGDSERRRLDLLTAVDFDGSFDAFDNVENARNGDHPLRGVVYYGVVETETHVFIVYSLFHPVDWSGLGHVDHENDMEHLWFVIEKTPTGNELRVVHTQAHGQLMGWSDEPPKGRFEISPGGIRRVDGRAAFYIEPQGHGPASCTHTGGLPYLSAIDCDPGAEDDMVIYRPDPAATRESVPEPDTSADGPVSATYALLPSYEELWLRRGAIAEVGGSGLWDEPFDYTGGRSTEGDPFDVVVIDPRRAHLGGDFAGDEGSGAGSPPWGYAAHDSFLGGTKFGARGDWLLDPAWFYHALYRDDRCAELLSFWNYLDAPYLDDVRDADAPVPWAGVDHGRRCDIPRVAPGGL